MFVIIALVLIFNFVRRLFPVAERSGSTENIMSILFDLGMAVGLVGLGPRILKAKDAATRPRRLSREPEAQTSLERPNTVKCGVASESPAPPCRE